MLDLKRLEPPPELSPQLLIVHLDGQADSGNGLRTEREFDRLFRETRPRHVLLDLSGLTFADSAFLSSLLFWRGELDRQGGRLVLYALRTEVASVLRIMALDRVLTIRPDRPSALAAVTEVA